MTRATKSNTVFGYGIHFHVVDVMDVIAKFATDSADVIISFSYGFFELFIPLFRIKLSSPFPAFPEWRVFSNKEGYSTSLRTKRVIPPICFRLCLRKCFSTIRANTINPSLPVNVMADCRTKIISRTSANSSFAFAAAYKASVFWLSAFPKSCGFPNSHALLTTTGVGAKTRLVFSGIDNLKQLFAIFTSFFNHIYTLTGVSRFISQYCCSGNTDETRHVRHNINLTNCICLNN